MRVHVVGCVKSGGEVELPADATVKDALEAAGGPGTARVEPTGVVAIRSPRTADGVYYKRRALDYRSHPEHLQVPLRDQDVLVVQFDLQSAAGGAVSE